MDISKISLGTAQLGLNYGISNISGKPDFDTAINMLRIAWKNGINTFDTSPQYGDSEKIIGSFISKHLKNETKKPIIITKLPKIKVSENYNFNEIYTFIKNKVVSSLNNLNLKKIPFYLLHHTDDILFGHGLVFDCLNQIKKEGLIDKFGTSIYTPNQVKETIEQKYINVIQVPINIFDHRLIKTGLLKKLRKNNIQIFARSIYLQGFFFKSINALPKNLEIAKPYLIKLNNLKEKYNIGIDKLAFLFIRDLPEITSIIIGTETIDQLKRNLSYLNEKSIPNNLRQEIFKEFSELPEQILNPDLWNI